MNNVTAMIKMIFKMDKLFLPITLLKSLTQGIKLLAIIYFPYIVIKSLEENYSQDYIFMTLGSFLFVLLSLSILHLLLKKAFVIRGRRIFHDIELSIGKKAMDVRFEQVEDPEILELKEKALFPIRNQGVVYNFVNQLSDLSNYFITIAVISGILVKVNLLIFLFIILVIIVNLKLTKKANEVEKKYMGDIMKSNRVFVYFHNLVTDFTYAKDIRVFNLDKYIGKKVKDSKDSLSNLAGKIFRDQGKIRGITSGNLELQTFVITTILLYMIYYRGSNISEAILVIGALSTFSKNTQNLISSILYINLNAHYFDGYFQFFNKLEEKIDKGYIKIDKINSIEFRNVSFKYPKQETYILDDLSISFEKGINYSLVGLNGAGKSTLVKLLAKLYKPSQGKIFINGIDLEEIDTVSFRDTLACVFQDFKMFAFSLEENITMTREVNRDRVEEILEDLNIKEKVDSLPKGLDSQIYKIFDKDGVSLSGGQFQKIAIARAKYKDSSVLIFDEPTASLDPIAEEEIFNKLYSIMEEDKKDTISIFISHRLSSCRLSDLIYVLDNGRIIEKGSFDDLVKDKDGLFNKMWFKQAEYYLLEEDNEEEVS